MKSDYINIFPELFSNELLYKENNGDGFVDFVVILLLRKIVEHLDSISILVETNTGESNYR